MIRRLLIVGCLTLFLFGSVVSAQEVPYTNVTIHVVQRGENLFRIALAYGTTVEVLTQLNGITLADNIYVGQRLLVPTTTTIDDGAAIHVVQPGESLESIAMIYGLTAETLAARNGITDQAGFYVGLTLLVSDAPSAAPASDPAAPPLIHTVARGETLFRIATQYGMTVNELVTANGIADPETIYAGQQLIIPGYSAPQLAVDLPAPLTSFDLFPLVWTSGQTGRARVTTSGAALVSATFLDQVLNDGVEQDNARHTFLIGVPLGTAPGVYPLTLTVTDNSGASVPFTTNVQVIGGGYWQENITVLADRLDLLNASVDQAEIALLSNAMSGFTPSRAFDAPMGLPAAAPLVSQFGNVRSYNSGAYQATHLGADFSAAPGAPIYATAPGRVVLADMLNVRGMTTIIDHGWGIFTVYCHQSDRYVSLGDTVATGQVIGAVGSSGRVSGAHLHWELWVNGVPVDPMQWVQQSFS